ncbi:MAG: type II toxin-antitoxin system HipA family toxin [Gammaproteobacteria bacterium]|nr:type II toxin-antitoxin system HipA family toxin [Gammaproteobacteria bacterium]
MTSEQKCFVYIVLPNTTDFVTAARFQISQTRDGIFIGEFVYGKNYLARSDAVELDPIELKLGQSHYETVRMNGFFGAIRDAMPDFWGRRVIERNAGKPILDEFDYLLHGPDDRAGALGFGLNAKPPVPRRKFNQTLNLESLQKMADAIINDEPTLLVNETGTRQVQELLLEGTSMGGARPKAVVEDNDSLWIAKFSSPEDRWNQPIVEYAFLNLAKKCGLNVADSKIVSVAGKDVLLVRRFDRDKCVDGYRRHRMVSALTLLKSEDNLVARGNWSYLLLADEIRRISATPKKDLHELFSRICFNAVISNLDDHPRNHAILAKDNNWLLSPAYDLTPTPTVAKDSRLLAMICGEYGRLANRENLLTTHERFLLSLEQAEKIIDNIVNTVKHEWDASLRRAGASEKDCAAIATAFIYEGFFYTARK